MKRTSENELIKDGQQLNGAKYNGSGMNGDCLDILTPELVEDIGITLDIISEYEVLVGNIGTVYTGTSLDDATMHYDEYVSQSKTGYGRAGGEDVTMMVDGEPSKEFQGSLADESEGE